MSVTVQNIKSEFTEKEIDACKAYYLCNCLGFYYDMVVDYFWVDDDDVAVCSSNVQQFQDFWFSIDSKPQHQVATLNTYKYAIEVLSKKQEYENPVLCAIACYAMETWECNELSKFEMGERICIDEPDKSEANMLFVRAVIEGSGDIEDGLKSIQENQGVISWDGIFYDFSDWLDLIPKKEAWDDALKEVGPISFMEKNVPTVEFPFSEHDERLASFYRFLGYNGGFLGGPQDESEFVPIPQKEAPSFERPPQSGTVYFLQEPSGLVKIGRTSRAAKKRLSYYKTAHPGPLNLRFTISSDDAHGDEAFFHDWFTSQKKHVRGEWFRLSENDLNDIKSKYRERLHDFNEIL